MAFTGSIDMYRRVPVDLLEGTKRGSFFSLCAVFTMATLFFLETRAFFTKTLVTDMLVDTNKEEKVRVNLNITMLDLRCDYVAVDVVSFLGKEQNVFQNINRWQLDADGAKTRFHGRSKNQKDILFHDETVTETIEELHENGEDAMELDATTLEFAMKENQFLFVDFFASWCSHCIKLAPTWETLAEVMHEVATETFEQLLKDEYPEGNHGYTEEDYHAAARVHLPVQIAKVDCVKHPDLCRANGIHAYPTLRLYVEGKQYADYKDDRTVRHFTNFLAAVESDFLKEKGLLDTADGVAKARLGEDSKYSKALSRRVKPEWKDGDHPGCQLSGYLLLDRVPGHFEIMARSPSHDLVASMTNVSHVIHSLSFGDPTTLRMVERRKAIVPDDFEETLKPMDGSTYVTKDFHSAYHHHLKIVTTNHKTYSSYNPNRDSTSYQIISQSQLTRYEPDVVPQAKFTYDLSPVAITFREETRQWYDYLTSLMAIIGGTFTVYGMMESTAYVMSRKKYA